MNLVQLNDNVIINSILGNQAVLSTFPGLLELSKAVKAKKQDCGTCGAQQRAVAQQIDRVRHFILAMPDTDIARLKQILKMETRQFVAYVNHVKILK